MEAQVSHFTLPYSSENHGDPHEMDYSPPACVNVPSFEHKDFMIREIASNV